MRQSCTSFMQFDIVAALTRSAELLTIGTTTMHLDSGHLLYSSNIISVSKQYKKVTNSYGRLS